MELCRAICRGIVKEKMQRKGGTQPLMLFRGHDVSRVHKLKDEDHVQPTCGLAFALTEHEAFDDLTGLALDWHKVAEARIKEIEFIDSKTQS